MPRVLAISGGVGGAKLVLGLSRLLDPDELTIVVNTADDETFHGLHVSPDVDTVVYALAGLTNPDTGWGVAGDSFHTLGVRSAGWAARRGSGSATSTWRCTCAARSCLQQAAR